MTKVKKNQRTPERAKWVRGQATVRELLERLVRDDNRVRVDLKIGDAMMLEVEWPEDADPAVVAAGMSALVAAMNKTAGAAGTAEAQAAAMGADYATLLRLADPGDPAWVYIGPGDRPIFADDDHQAVDPIVLGAAATGRVLEVKYDTGTQEDDGPRIRFRHEANNDVQFVVLSPALVRSLRVRPGAG